MQEHLEIVKKRFESDNYAKFLGIVLDELTDDTVQMHMQLRENMLNEGIIHWHASGMNNGYASD